MSNYTLKFCLLNVVFIAFGSLAGENLTNRVDAEIDEQSKLTINSGYLTNYIFRGIDPSTGEKGSMKLVKPTKSALDFDFVDIEWDGLLPKGVVLKGITREKEPTEIYLDSYPYPNSIKWDNSDFTLTGASLLDLIQNLPSDRQGAIDAITLFLLNTAAIAEIGLDAFEGVGNVSDISLEKFDKIKELAELILDSKALIDRAESLITYSEVVHETAILFMSAANLKEEDNLFLYEYLSYIEVTLTSATKLKNLIGYQGQSSKDDKRIIRGTIKNQYKEFKNDFDLDKPAEEVLDFIATKFAEDFEAANNENEKLEQILRYIVEPLNASLKAYVKLMELERKAALKAGFKVKAERYKNQITTMRNGRALLTFTSLLLATPDFSHKIYKEPELIVPLIFDLGTEVIGQLIQSLTIDDVEVVTKAAWQKISRLDGRSSSFHKIRGGVKKFGSFMQRISAGMVIGNKLIPFIWDAVLAPNQINSSVVNGEIDPFGSIITQAKIYKLDNANNKEHISTISNSDLHNTNISLEDGDRLLIDVSLSRPKMFDETRSPWLINMSQEPMELYSLDISSAGSHSQNFLCVRKLFGDLIYAAYHLEEFIFSAIPNKCGAGTWFGSDWFDGSRLGSSIYHSHKSLNERYKLQTLLTDVNPMVSYEYTYQYGDHPILILVQGNSLNQVKHEVTIMPKPINIGFSFDEVRLSDGSLNVLFDVSQIIGSEHDPVSHFIWNFGDGSGDMISYDQAMAHNYNEGGTHTITLTVVTESGQQYQVKDVVILGVKPDAPYFVKIDSTINDDDGVSLELFWQEVEGINEFNIYIANESFADLDDIANYASLSGARRVSAISSPPYKVDDLALNTEYFVVITSQNHVNESDPSNELKVEVNKAETGTNELVRLTGASSAKGLAIDYDSNGNAFVAGNISDPYFNNQQSSGMNDVVVIKFDTSGNIVWNKLLGGSGQDFVRGIKITKNNEVVVVGSTTSDSYEGIKTSLAGQHDAFVSVLNSDGSQLWSDVLGESLGSDVATSVSFDNEGGIYISGYTSSHLDGNENNGRTDTFITKYSESGVKDWTRLIGGDSWEVDAHITVDSDKNIFVAGGTYSSSFNSQPNLGSYDLYIVKLSSQGEILWSRLIGNEGSETANSVKVRESGGVYIVGATSSSYFDGHKIRNDGASAFGDHFIIEYNDGGDKIGSRILDRPSSTLADHLHIGMDDNLYFLSNNSRTSYEGFNNKGHNDAYVTKFDIYGTKHWTIQLGGSSNDYLGYPNIDTSPISVSPNGIIYLVGTTKSNYFQGIENQTKGSDIFFVRLTSNSKNSTTTGKLNDTGITLCADGSSNNLDCPVTDYEGQDAEYGRDAQAKAGTLEKVGGGDGGFDFTKLDANGNDLPESATAWSCVRDNHTGLIWEVKTNDGGLHDKNDRYNWYNPDSKANGGYPGYQDDDGDICYGYDASNEASYCNTHAYVERVNKQSLCGANDWRMPTRLELMGIVDNNSYSPAIDTQYFPQTRSSWFWSSSPNANDSRNAWSVSFGNGNVSANGKYSDGSHVRLVRARP